MVAGAQFELINDAYELNLTMRGRELCMRLQDRAMAFDVADGPYMYRASRHSDEGSAVAKWLKDVSLEMGKQVIEVSGTLAGLTVTHSLELPGDRAIMEERLVLRNPSDTVIELEDIAFGMQRPIADEVGKVCPELSSDRLVAIPFRHRPTDPPEYDWDFRFADLMERPGREHRASSLQTFGYMPSMRYASEGWAWMHGEHTLGIFKFNQEGMEFSVLSSEPDESGLVLRFGGASMAAGDPSALRDIQPGQTIEMGVTRYQTVKGDYQRASYAFRGFLDEKGCRFPKGYNPPVHWNELYDNPEWNVRTPGKPERGRKTRAITYTRKLIEEEAAKARDYSCESLYLDPGWDTDFGTFLWGEEWLGDRKEFIELIRERYGLKVSLHCPLATWMSRDGRGVPSWPEQSFRMGPGGNILEGSVCLGSRQYLNEATKRLLVNCADGATFLMFDGNWWNGGCRSPDHGHSVPYTMEDHVRANVQLARRVHEKYPDVLIEMHDMVAGGARQRYTPVYYKYGLPGSYDENWGFELMWDPMDDIISGRARSLYYYNLGCNVPLYLHIDLRDDNEHCLLLWWYASTCRHLGVGGTHSNRAVAEAQKAAMLRYRKLERFYKEGEFYGVDEQLHVHVLPDEGAFVMNIFNLSDEPSMIKGRVELEEMGLGRDRYYITPKGGRFDPENGTFMIARRMPPWSAQVAEVRQLPAS